MLHTVLSHCYIYAGTYLTIFDDIFVSIIRGISFSIVFRPESPSPLVLLIFFQTSPLPTVAHCQCVVVCEIEAEYIDPASRS